MKISGLNREDFKKAVSEIIKDAAGGKPSPNDNYCAWFSNCSECPLGGLNAICLCCDRRIDALFNTVETVVKWAKEHEIGTNDEKER